ncbi:MAG: LacI family DNA-binding transcriptional regulator [Saccharospirillum sp.]|uniref:LacI family DNA-binding transcriptional regulator n=1 Tax=Saccharospirillum sp. TaxID=2033801 RepID=UPI00329A0669
MNNTKVTSHDVARHAGVSQSAVSRYFTPGGSVSKKKAELIQAAADELGYRPNVLARSMITGRSKIVGLVVAYFENQFYPEVIELLSVGLQAKGYHVLVFMASRTVGDVEPIVQEMLDYQVDGILMLSVSMSSTLAEQCASQGIPVMLFNRDQADDRLSSVTSENGAGGELAAELLVKGGYERIAYLAGFEGASTQILREQGFLKGLKAAGKSLYAREVGDFHYDQAAAAARRLFSMDTKPDAVFVGNDHMAFAAMDVIRHEFHLSIPGDVAVVGFDDVPIAAWPSFNLTTIRQDVDTMVDETVNRLLDMVEGRATEPSKVRIPVVLVERGSTRARPKS